MNSGFFSSRACALSSLLASSLDSYYATHVFRATVHPFPLRARLPSPMSFLSSANGCLPSLLPPPLQNSTQTLTLFLTVPVWPLVLRSSRWFLRQTSLINPGTPSLQIQDAGVQAGSHYPLILAFCQENKKKKTHLLFLLEIVISLRAAVES